MSVIGEAQFQRQTCQVSLTVGQAVQGEAQAEIGAVGMDGPTGDVAENPTQVIGRRVNSARKIIQ